MGLVPARRPGWLLEPRCKSGPRGMAAQSRLRKRREDRTRLTGPLAHCSARKGGAIFLSGIGEWRSRRDRTTGDFPRWRSYGDKGRHAAKVRLCDREGCNEIGDRPAPKAPHSKDRWYFCEAHAAEYNRNWNYFAGLEPGRGRASRGRGRAGKAAFANPRSGNGAGRATAAEAATRCARSMRSNSTATPTSRP